MQKLTHSVTQIPSDLWTYIWCKKNIYIHSVDFTSGSSPAVFLYKKSSLQSNNKILYHHAVFVTASLLFFFLFFCVSNM